MFGLGKLTRQATKTVAQLPSLPQEIAEGYVKGMEEGVDELTKRKV